jgi:hypothetical protein
VESSNRVIFDFVSQPIVSITQAAREHLDMEASCTLWRRHKLAWVLVLSTLYDICIYSSPPCH